MIITLPDKKKWTCEIIRTVAWGSPESHIGVALRLSK